MACYGLRWPRIRRPASGPVKRWHRPWRQPWPDGATSPAPARGGSAGSYPQRAGVNELRSFGYRLDAAEPGLPHIALFALGLTHYQLGDDAGALPLFNAAIDNLPARPAGLQAGFLYFFRANGRARTGQPLAEVVADLEKARAMNPGVVEIRENLAKAYTGACKPDGSTALDSALAEIMPALQAGQRGSASEQTRADLEAAYRRLGRNTDARRVAGLAATPVATPTTPCRRSWPWPTRHGTPDVMRTPRGCIRPPSPRPGG